MKRPTVAPVLATAIAAAVSCVASADTGKLDEIVVTAMKRETSLQSTPIAVTAINAEQLKNQGIFSVDDFRRGSLPMLTIQTLPINPATLQLTIRGIGNLDVSQMTRESPVAVYVDGVYLARAQGLAMDLVDLERVEVLRGPQGTLFGRNAVGGALNFISRKPSGELGLAQTLSAGNFGMYRSTTRVDLPEVAGLSTKLDFFKYSRDGLIENTMPGSHDFAELEKMGGRIGLHWQLADDWSVDYAYENSQVENTSDYGVYKTDPANQVGGPEHGRIKRSRLPTPYLEPGKVEQEGHSLTIDWSASELLDVKLIAAYRDLVQNDRTNFAESFSVGWFSPADGNRIEQDQSSLELQFVGKTADSRIDYAAGIFYFEEDTEENYVGMGYLIPDFTNSFPDLHLGNTFFVSSQDLLGVPFYPSQFVNGFTIGLTGDPSLYDPTISDQRHIISDARSIAAYAQFTWTPSAEVLRDRLHLTAGVRETRDKKSGKRPVFNGVATTDSFDLDQDHFDYALTAAWDWSDTVNSYLRYSTAYQGGGANIRSASFDEYKYEVAKSTELGVKAEMFDNRVRLNLAVFYSEYQDRQLDFLTPEVQTETINASNPAEMRGAEIELTAQATDRLLLNFSYSYLNGDLPLQPNTTVPGAPLTRFRLPETPEHAGMFSANYEVATLPIGTLNLYAEVSSRSDLYLTTGADEKTGGYTLYNARASLEGIKLGSMSGEFEVSVWGYNLSDELYDAVQFSFPPTVIMGQNEPRTYGVDVRYVY